MALVSIKMYLLRGGMEQNSYSNIEHISINGLSIYVQTFEDSNILY
jgi:hypothetical protein